MSCESAPLFSIIIAVFNGKATLQQCIDSVTQQTCLSKELIIIDGGSTDGSVDLIKTNQEKLAYWVSEPDRGIYNAWNKGVAQARGEWICFLGADDYFWDATVLERMAAHLAKLSAGIRVAYGQIMLVNADGELRLPVGDSWEQVKERFKEFMCIPHVGTMHRRILFEQLGKFDESFRIAGDYEFLLRELSTGEAAFMPDIITAAQRHGGISTESAHYSMVLRETWRAHRLHGTYLPRKFLRNEMKKEYLTRPLMRLLWILFGERLARKLLDLRRRLKGLPPHWTKP